MNFSPSYISVPSVEKSTAGDATTVVLYNHSRFYIEVLATVKVSLNRTQVLLTFLYGPTTTSTLTPNLNPYP